MTNGAQGHGLLGHALIFPLAGFGLSSASFGPVHPCPRCGMDVQMVDRGLGRPSRLEETETGLVHDFSRCPKLAAQIETWDIRQCLCGRIVFMRDHEKRDYPSGSPHTCRKPKAAQARARMEPKIEPKAPQDKPKRRVGTIEL